jgi:3-oxoacyl-[acyl-carrier-protein] synthase III
VLGLGHYLPAEVLPNDSIVERLGVEDEWIVRRTGIRRATVRRRTSAARIWPPAPVATRSMAPSSIRAIWTW